MQRANNQISLIEAQHIIPDRQALHTALVRKGYIVPRLKDKLMTNRFMIGKCLTLMAVHR